MLGIEPWALHVLGKRPTTELQPWPFLVLFDFETRSHQIAQVGLELTILLPLSLSKGWDYRPAPPGLAVRFH